MADVGRPTLMTEETIRKLDDAFLIGATDKEACFVAGLTTETLYAYCRENPEYSVRKEALKDMIKYQAKSNISSAIKEKKDLQLSQWYLERKGKDEGFSSRTETTGKDGGPIEHNIDITKAGEITKKYEKELKENISQKLLEV